MKKSEIIELGEKYFSQFENKDISSLKNFYSEEIILFDPIIKNVSGIENVLLVNSIFFEKTKKIIIKSKKLFVDYYSNTLIAEIEIQFDNNLVNLVDIIEFNSNKKIIKITAYLDSQQI